MAFPDDANIYGPSTALFAPGELNGVQNPVFRRGKKAARHRLDEPRASRRLRVDAALRRRSLGTIFGSGDETVFRGGWDITYFDEGTNMFASTAGNNTGHSQAICCSPGTQLHSGRSTLQSPLPPFQESPAAYQEVRNQSEITFINGLGAMLSDIETGYVQAWNIGLQRQVAKNTVVEVRYVGNRANNIWHSFGLNEVNIFENGFLDEFKVAQANLAINEANGRPASPTTTCPGQVALPIFDAAFGARGRSGPLPGNQAYTNGNFICDLRQWRGGPARAAARDIANYLCRMAGSTFSPVRHAAELHRAGPVRDELLHGEPVRGQRADGRRRRRLERRTTDCNSSCAAATRTGSPPT